MSTIADSPDPEDAALQADLLSFLLRRHPAQTALGELHGELADRSYGPYDADGVDRAVRDLVHVGLVHRNGEFVLPSRAAVYRDRLPH